MGLGTSTGRQVMKQTFQLWMNNKEVQMKGIIHHGGGKDLHAYREYMHVHVHACTVMLLVVWY